MAYAVGSNPAVERHESSNLSSTTKCEGRLTFKSSSQVDENGGVSPFLRTNLNGAVAERHTQSA